MLRKLEYSIVCDSFSFDHYRHTLSAFHIVDRKQVSQTPTVIPSLDCVTAWRRTGADDEVAPSTATLKVISPGGFPVNEFTRTIDATSRLEYSIFGVTNIPIRTTGELMLELSLDELVVAEHVIDIELQEVDDPLNTAD